MIYLVRCLKSLESCYKSAKYKSTVLATLSPSTNFSDVWLTVKNSSGLAGGPWAINTQTQPNCKRWREVDSDKSSTPPCLHLKGTHCLPGLPVSWSSSKLHVPLSASSSSSLLTLQFNAYIEGWCPQCVCVCMCMGPGLCWWFSVTLIFGLHQNKTLKGLIDNIFM